MILEKGLKGHDIFARFTVDEIHKLDKISHVKDFFKGEIIFELNQLCSHIYMLMEGSVYLVLPAKPSDFSFAFAEIKENELFGLSPLLGQKRFTAEGKAHSDCKIMVIEAVPFLEMLKSNHLVGHEVLNQVASIYYFRYLKVLHKLQNIVSEVSLI